MKNEAAGGRKRHWLTALVLAGWLALGGGAAAMAAPDMTAAPETAVWTERMAAPETTAAPDMAVPTERMAAPETTETPQTAGAKETPGTTGTAQTEQPGTTAPGATETPQTAAPGTAPGAMEAPQAAAPGTSAVPQAARPFRVALVPVVDATGGWLDDRTAAELMIRLEEALRIPLNNTMHWAEYVSEDDCEAALRAELGAAGRRARIRDTMQPLAARLGADLAVCVEVTSFYEYRHINWEGEIVLETSARLTLFAYDTATGRLIRENAGGFDVNEYHPSYEVEVKLMEALDEALEEANLRPLLPPKRTAGEKPAPPPAKDGRSPAVQGAAV